MKHTPAPWRIDPKSLDAPELLDALKAVLSLATSGTIATHETGKPTRYTNDEIAAIARATILKAEG